MKTIQHVAILGGQRTPFVRYNTAFKDLSNQQLLTDALKHLVQKFDLQGQRVGEVVGGAVLKHSSDFNLTRESLLSAGLSPQTPAYEIQQACATSIQASIAVSNKIALGQIEVGIAGGVDSASDVPVTISESLRHVVLDASRARTAGERLKVWSRLRPSMLKPAVPNVDEPRTGMSMGEHCEVMVKDWKISRQAQDALALASHRNGVTAYERGFYDDLVFPVNGVARDGILRADTSMERLAKLSPAFDKKTGKGSLTAGNSTPLTDGASAVLYASESWAEQHHFTPLAWLVDAETAAVDFASEDPEGLLMAPAHAVARLLKRNGLTLQDFDYYEIHEAFSGQVLCTLAAWESETYCREKLGLDKPLGSIDRVRLNVNGGSVGLGHPFAATGTRIIAAGAKQLAELRQQSGKKGRTLISVCAAGGLGAAAILEG
jgi:acetyl-CoA C-acetyltransferase